MNTDTKLLARLLRAALEDLERYRKALTEIADGELLLSLDDPSWMELLIEAQRVAASALEPNT